jgi:erythromycin esterase
VRSLVVLLALVGCAPRLSPTAAAGQRSAVGDPRGQPQTDDPAVPPTDLAVLGAIVGDARIVGLGSPGAGARELPRLQHRFFRYLVEQAGFTGLALDADATAALALDRFVHGAAIDPVAAVLALGDRDLATHELVDLLKWMQQYNAGHGQVLRVFGLDPADPDGAAALVLVYLEKVDPAYVPKARSLLTGGQQIGVDAVLARLDARRRDYFERADPVAWSEARQQAELVAQGRRMAETWEYEAAEFARARNAEWALAQLGERGRLVVIADNLRVAAEVPGATPVMGDFLRQWYAANYRPIAASFADGAVLVTLDASTLCAAPLPLPRPRSLDAALVGLAAPIALIDLRSLADPALKKLQVLREVTGAHAEDHRLRPAVAFDAIVALQQVHAADPLGAEAHAALRPHGPCYTVLGD